MRIFTLIVLTLTSSGFLFAEPTLKGTITDSSGAIIKDAVILIRWDSAGSRVGLKSNVGIKGDLTARTDAFGGFSVNLPPGFYDVFVTFPAFTPVCRKIRIHDGSSVTYNAALQINGLVADELADAFTSIPTPHRLLLEK